MKKIILTLTLLFAVSYTIFAQCSNPNAGEDNAICGNVYTLNATNTTIGYWQAISNGNVLNPQPVFSPNAATPDAIVTVTEFGIFDFVWIDNSGPCSDTVMIEFVQLPVVSAGPDKDVCGNFTTLEGTSGGFGGYWIPNGANLEEYNNPNSEAYVAAYVPTTFTWIESNSAVTQSLSCSATDDVVITFWRVPTATILTNPADSTVCGLTYNNLRAENPGSGITGLWYNSNTAIVYGDAFSWNTWATVPNYGYHDFYWIEERDFCADTAGPLRIHFIEIPTANAGLDFFICGQSGNLNAIPSMGTGTWSTPSTSYITFEDINNPNSAITSSVLNSGNLTNPYFNMYWTEDNTEGCIDRDTVRVRFFDFESISETDVLDSFGPYLIDSEPINLSSEISGGAWSGPGIINEELGTFDPSLVGLGVHFVTCTFSNAACNATVSFMIKVVGANFIGHIFKDLDNDCVYDEGEGIANNLIYINPGPYYFITDSMGLYKGYLEEGAYTAHAAVPDSYRFSCPETGFINFTITNTNDTISGLDIGLNQEFECAVLNVNTQIFILRPCFYSYVRVDYSNIGTVDADNAYIDINLDSNLSFVSSVFPYTMLDESTIRFNIGVVEVGEENSILFRVTTQCDINLLGQTRCISAEIFPQGNCDDNTDIWDNSNISVKGMCENNLNVCFTLVNSSPAGIGDMLFAREFRIFANDTLVHTGTFQHAGGASTEICWAANGSAIRLEADQHPDYPYGDYATNTVEGCGDANGTSYGYITTNTYGDDPQYIDIDCRIISSSYDPNNKEVQPSGITENHYIESNTLLTYRVNFQNTGTDTAFTVVIVDTLSSKHDILSFERGICSHPCEFEIYGNGILVWTFNNILLPDSAANEPESHGFVTYKVRTNEMSAAEYGTQILNNAAIYFDFNPPVITNTTQLVFWNLPLLPQAIPGLHLNLQFSIFPNPATQSFTVDTKTENCNLQIFDTNGKAVKEITNYNGEQITITDLSKGLYFVKLIANDKISVGKLVVE